MFLARRVVWQWIARARWAERPALFCRRMPDAIPSPDWVDANLRAVSHGADIVGGHIVGDAAEEALLGPRFVHRAKRHLYYTGLVDKLTTYNGSDFS